MDKHILAVQIERAAEQLRQERELFDQQKAHDARWFCLRLVMGYSSVVLLVAVMFVASYILLNNQLFPTSVVTSAGAALFADVLGLLLGVWKIALNPNYMTRLAPTTTAELPGLEGGSQPSPASAPKKR